MRQPAVAGYFYPSDGNDLRDLIEWCFSHPIGPDECGFDGTSVSAIVSPHAGLAISGPNAANAFAEIVRSGHHDVYVVIGPDHRGHSYGENVLCDQDFLTPLGLCRVDHEILNKLSSDLPINDRAHALEHSIEVIVPFIQYVDPDARMVPIMMGDQSIGSAKALGKAIRNACEGKDVVIIASSDMCHYIPRDKARSQAEEAMGHLLDMDIGSMYASIEKSRMSICGYGPIAAAYYATGPASVELLRYSDSYDILGGDPGSVVGYQSAVFR